MWKANNVNTVVIFDEYYQCLKTKKLALENEKLPAVFTVGDSEKLVVVTGHHSKQFKSFLLRRFDSTDVKFCHDDMPVFKKEKAMDRVRVVTEEDQNVLVAKMVEAIKEANQSGPVIVFLMNQIPTSTIKD